MSDDELRAMGHEIQTQDNAITVNPIFMVQEELRVYGVKKGYDDGHERDEDGKKVRYRTEWVHRMPFFTRKGAEEYIRINGHNMRNPRIWVESGYRNAEWEAVRAHLSSLAAPSPEGSAK